MVVDGVVTPVPNQLVVRADLVTVAGRSVWRFTLEDGRIYDGHIETDGAYVYFDGTNQFGVREEFRSSHATLAGNHLPL